MLLRAEVDEHRSHQRSARQIERRGRLGRDDTREFRLGPRGVDEPEDELRLARSLKGTPVNVDDRHPQCVMSRDELRERLGECALVERAA
jgi:hypothetical protein